MKNMFEFWKDFAENAIPKSIEGRQLLEMQYAFYAGSMAFITLAKDADVADSINTGVEDLKREVMEMLSKWLPSSLTWLPPHRDRPFF